VTAREDESQTIVADVAGVFSVMIFSANHGGLLQLGGAGCRAADTIRRAVARGCREPGAGIARDAIARPCFDGTSEGVLRALLGEIPIAGDPDERRNDAAPFLMECGRDCCVYISQIGLTSIEPLRAPGIFDATSIASSRFLQSTRK